MSESTLEADYVIAGAGAVGMAFADTLVAETKASLIIVDRRPRPGGHWNDAYSFASGAEICGYFDRVMGERLLGSARVTYLPLHELDDEGVATSLRDGRRLRLVARRRWVDAT